ncbi:MAG: hypothetical protein H7068_11705 [Pedobacter sp.]|nr:hypothetical protein [Chitinophagaceae bacterium]
MTIEHFKTLTLTEKLTEIKYNGDLLGSYDRPNEEGGIKVPGDIFGLYDFWVYLSDDEQMVIPTRKSPLPPVVVE